MSDDSASNPYDYGSPVTEQNELADRTNELEKIREYLELSVSEDPTYNHLAVTGSRASGKTSLINVTKQVAEEMGFLAIKLSLNEELVSSDVKFFSEILDTTVSRGIEMGMYGGTGSEIYRKLRDTIDRLDIDAQLELPLAFGNAYIGAKKSQESSSIPQKVLRDDLKEIYTEAKDNDISTIVIILDECDLISKNKAILQKLRNVFTNINGYMLILSGTDKMFDELSDVFSPLPRSFVSIEVDSFDDEDDTSECILSPLTEDEQNKIEDDTIKEVHQITGGSPYEINLVSHYMYREYDREDIDDISLSRNVLDDVLNEIEKFRKDDDQLLADLLPQISIIQVNILISILEFPDVSKEYLTKYTILNYIDQLHYRDSSELENKIRNEISELKSSGIIGHRSENKLVFQGDRFDNLYFRYYVASEPRLNNSVEQGRSDALIASIGRKVLSDILFDEEFSELTIHCLGFQPKGDILTDSSQREGTRSEKEHIVTDFERPNIFPPFNTVFSDTRFVAETDPIKKGSLTKFLHYSRNSFSFRCNIEWMNSSFLVVIGDSPLSKERIETRLTEHLEVFNQIGLDIILDDELKKRRKAEEYLDQGKEDESIKKLEEAIELNPHYSGAKLAKAVLKRKQGEVADAKGLIQELQNKGIYWPKAYIENGIITIIDGDKEKGYDQILDALEKQFTREKTVTNTGYLRVAIEKLETIGLDQMVENLVSDFCDIEIKTYPRRAGTLNNNDKIRSLIEAERTEEAKEMIDRFFNSDPLMNHISTYELALSCAIAGLDEEAMKLLRIISRGPRDFYIDKAMEVSEFDELRSKYDFEELQNNS